MNNKQQKQTEKTSTEIFKYNVENGVSEYHVMIHACCPEDTYEQQLNAVVNAYFTLLEGELLVLFRISPQPKVHKPYWNCIM